MTEATIIKTEQEVNATMENNEKELSKLELKIKELEEKENLSRVEKSILESLKKEQAENDKNKDIKEDLKELEKTLEELNDKEDKDEYDLKIISELKTEMAKINKYINEQNKVEEKPILMENGKYFPTMNRHLYNACNVLSGKGFNDFTYVFNMTEKQTTYTEISKSNGTFKELNAKGFYKSVSVAYFKQFGSPLNFDTKAIKIDPETGEFEKYTANNGQEYFKTVNEKEILEGSLREVHGVVFTLQEEPLSTFTNEYNGREYFNAKCDPVKIRKLKQKCKNKSKIKKITKETARENGYPHVYAYYHNLINPNDPKNQGKIRGGDEDDDIMSLIFNRYAYILQTGKKVFTYPIFCSEQGLGKGEHNENFINWIFGDELSGLSSNDALSEQFNGQLRSKLYVAINEVFVERKDWDKVSMRLKALTDKKMEVRAMQKDRFNEELLASIEMYSNSDTPFKIEMSDRRAIPIWGGEFLPDFCARLGYEDTAVFIDKMKEEMESFVIDLLRLELKEQMARIGIIFSDFRKDIINRTNSIVDVVVDAVKNQKISEIQTIFQDIDEDLLKELTDHISNGFVTTKDCNIIGNELLDNYGQDLIENENDKNSGGKTPTQKKIFWDRRLGKVKNEKYINEEGKETSKDIRILKGYKKGNLEKCFNVYVESTKNNSFDNLTLDIDDDFSADNIKENNTKQADFLDNL